MTAFALAMPLTKASLSLAASELNTAKIEQLTGVKGQRNEQPIVDGDFVMFENELQPVLTAPRGASINIVAIHNHMVEESPRMVFLHYWGVEPMEQLVLGVKAALETQKK
jgi:hypothetical protein